MCIICKTRFKQENLFRFWLKNKKPVLNLKYGRSSYICSNCLNADKKNTKKAFLKYGLIQEELKEIFLDGESKNSRNC